MTVNTEETREKILIAALQDVPFDGWSEEVLAKATLDAGYEADMSLAVFPDGLIDLVSYFSEWADQQMLQKIASIDPEDLKIRARVKNAAMARFEILEPHKEAVRKAAQFWARPFRSLRAKQMIWNTADAIWKWAGDTATDYNHYTKRGLLVGVLASTTLYWLAKNDACLEDVDTFLKNRIENVLKIGKVTSKFKDLKNLASFIPFKTPFANKQDTV